MRTSRTYVVVSTLSILLFLGGAVGTSEVIPPFENSDEVGHVGYVMYVRRYWRLPRVIVPPRDVFDQEGFQTPLYYVSAALFVGATASPVRPQRDVAFQFAPAPAGSGPHRLYRPITEASSPALQAMASACRRVRMVSIVWGVLAAIAAAVLLWRLANGSVAQAGLALAIFLFNPRWLETAASAGNDVAVTAAATATLVLVVTVLRKEEATLRDAALLGVCTAVTALTKLNGLGLVALGAGVVVLKAARRWPATLVFLTTAGAAVVPWLIRNELLYGDLLATAARLHGPFVSLRETPLGLIRFFREEFQGFRWSYFAVFGQFAVLADLPVYRVLDVFLAVCGVAAAVAWISDFRHAPGTPERALVLVPVLWIAVVFAEFASFNRSVFASQGRLMFPAAAGLAHVLARGCLWPIPRPRRPVVALVLVGVLVSFAAYVVLSVLPRAYPAGVVAR